MDVDQHFDNGHLKMEKTPTSSTTQANMEDCPICLSPISGNGQVTTTCGHTFCLACFLKHTDFKNDCPLCRGQIRDRSEITAKVNTFDKRLWSRVHSNIVSTMEALKNDTDMPTSGDQSNAMVAIMTSSTSVQHFEQNAQATRARVTMPPPPPQHSVEPDTEHISYSILYARGPMWSLERREQDFKYRIFLGSRLRFNPFVRLYGPHGNSADPHYSRRRLCIDRDGRQDNTLATIKKVMAVNMKIKIDGDERILVIPKDFVHLKLVSII